MSIASTSPNIRTSAPRIEASGTDCVFTNAHVVMWLPPSVLSVYDGPTSSVEAARMTPTPFLPQPFKILVEIQIDSEQEFRRYEKLGQDWVFEEHPTLSIQDGKISRQLRKDIRDPERGRILWINGMVAKTPTFDRDMETAKKMIESIKLLKSQP